MIICQLFPNYMHFVQLIYIERATLQLSFLNKASQSLLHTQCKMVTKTIFRYVNSRGHRFLPCLFTRSLTVFNASHNHVLVAGWASFGYTVLIRTK